MRASKPNLSAPWLLLCCGLGMSVSACTADIAGDGPPANENPGGSGAAGSGNSSGTAGSAGDPGNDPPGIEGIGWSTRYPRLSHAQWENTVRDLLALDALPDLAGTFALDPDNSRFDTYGVRTVSSNLWLDYQRGAEVVAADVARDANKLAKVVSTTARGNGKAFVTELGERAFRRPLTEQEITSHTALFEQATTLFEGGDAFVNGAELVMRAFLQSPHFLYRVESSTQTTDKKIWLSGYEVASRLSYGLWNTMPSAELLSAAKAGELTTPAGVDAWTRRMVTDPRAKGALVGFHDQLFNVVSYGTIAKNQKLYPTFTEALAPVLRDEARRFFEEIVVTRGASVKGLLTTPVTFVNDQTAPFYGLTPSYGTQLTRVDLDPVKRAGILTQLGFLSKYGSQSQSDPILRGVHISLDIVCSALPAPPNDIPALPALLDGQTNRERVELLTSKAPCSSCHTTFINPLGFALENYDTVGQWRDTDNGQPVNAAASFQIDGQTSSYNGPVELSQMLANSPTVHRCYSKNWLEYVMGRKPAAEEDGVLDKVAAASLQADDVGGLLSTITALETFRARPQEIQ